MAASRFLFESRRLGYREFIPDDAHDLYLLNSDPEVIRHTGDAPFHSEEEARAFILGYSNYQDDGFGRWSVVRRVDQQYLGWCGLNRIGEDIDLGYRFFQSVWGRGYATEAAQACISFGFGQLGISRIIARALPENIASWKVLEKVGMNFAGFGQCKGLDGARIYEISREGDLCENTGV